MSPSTVLTKKALYHAVKWRGARFDSVNHGQCGTRRHNAGAEASNNHNKHDSKAF